METDLDDNNVRNGLLLTLEHFKMLCSGDKAAYDCVLNILAHALQLPEYEARHHALSRRHAGLRQGAYMEHDRARSRGVGGESEARRQRHAGRDAPLQRLHEAQHRAPFVSVFARPSPPVRSVWYCKTTRSVVRP